MHELEADLQKKHQIPQWYAGVIASHVEELKSEGMLAICPLNLMIISRPNSSLSITEGQNAVWEKSVKLLHRLS